MEKVIWLSFMVPDEYFSGTLTFPKLVELSWSIQIIWALRTVGIIGLVLGGIWGIAARIYELLKFLILPAASQFLVVSAGVMYGWFQDPSLQLIVVTIGFAFILLQIVGAGYLVFQSKGARLPATALAVFTSTYAAFASFVAVMAFTGDWL